MISNLPPPTTSGEDPTEATGWALTHAFTRSVATAWLLRHSLMCRGCVLPMIQGWNRTRGAPEPACYKSRFPASAKRCPQAINPQAINAQSNPRPGSVNGA
ncbi:hypothetical protein GCM10027038_01830 [Arthrobacter bambusae]